MLLPITTPLTRAMAAVGLLLSMAVAATAWACVPQPTIVAVQPRASGPAGGQVTVLGDNFDGAPVEIRWNGLQGALLGTGNGPSFSIPITVPDGEPGLYVLTALSRQPGGGVGGTARASFQIEAGDGAGGAAATPGSHEEDGPAAAAGPAASSLVAGAAVGVFAAGALTMWLGTRLGRRSAGRGGSG
ncbi:MAG: hypothetical protein WD794_05470 [Mycobacteriales bacterium]